MAKFIEVGEFLISTESISRVEFINDDVYLGLFPKDDKGKVLVDYVPFVYGKICLKDGQEVEMILDLYPPEELQKDEEQWIKENRTFINLSMIKLKESIGEITKIDGFEYQY